MVLAGIGGIVCLLLPSMTNNRISFDEAILGLIPAVIVFFLGLVITIAAAFLVMKARKTAAPK
jgi:hypothetical protein